MFCSFCLINWLEIVLKCVLKWNWGMLSVFQCEIVTVKTTSFFFFTAKYAAIQKSAFVQINYWFKYILRLLIETNRLFWTVLCGIRIYQKFLVFENWKKLYMNEIKPRRKRRFVHVMHKLYKTRSNGANNLKYQIT